MLQLNLAFVGLLNVSLALEDPFDNQGLDGIYVDEALFEAEQVCNCGVLCPLPVIHSSTGEPSVQVQWTADSLAALQCKTRRDMVRRLRKQCNDRSA